MRSTLSTKTRPCCSYRGQSQEAETSAAITGLIVPIRDVRYASLGSKQPLRDAALSSLDPALFDRPKSGFVLPLEVWTREALKGEMDSAFRDRDRCEAAGLAPDAVAKLWRAWQQRAPGLYWSRLWSLHTLLHWTRSEGVSL